MHVLSMLQSATCSFVNHEFTILLCDPDDAQQTQTPKTSHALSSATRSSRIFWHREICAKA